MNGFQSDFSQFITTSDFGSPNIKRIVSFHRSPFPRGRAGIHDANLANLLGELLKAGFLGREDDFYSVADPVLAYALS